MLAGSDAPANFFWGFKRKFFLSMSFKVCSLTKNHPENDPCSVFQLMFLIFFSLKKRIFEKKIIENNANFDLISSLA